MPIRFIVQSNPDDADQRMGALIRYAEKARAEEGCLQFEDFRGLNEPQDLLHLELWESPEHWDRHWYGLLRNARSIGGDALLELLELARATDGSPASAPRKDGQNGVELYDQRFYGYDGVWQPAFDSRPQSIRWPAWSAVRIIVQQTTDPAGDSPGRSRPPFEGQDQLESFRGVEYPENWVLMESWATPQIYDGFWLNHMMKPRDPSEPRWNPIPARRRYGVAGNEWHNLCYYSLVDGIWEPRQPSLRSSVVRW